MSQEGRTKGWYVLEVLVDHTEWCLDMNSRNEGKFDEVFQVDLQY